MKDRCRARRGLVLFSVLVLISVCRVSVAKTYYVDSVGGNDSNSGTTTFHAWQTLAWVNSVTFQPGDQLLFKAGGTGQVF